MRSCQQLLSCRRGLGKTGKTYVGDTQSGKVVPLAKLAAHPLACACGTAAVSEGGGHVAALLRAETSLARRLVAHAGGGVGGALGADGGHGVLVGTAGGEMFSVTDTTLDGLVLELVLHGVGLGVLGLLLGVLLPVGREAEDDVLADRGGVALGADLVVGRQAELAPGLALGDARVDDLAVRHQADPPGGLDFLALLVVAVGDGRLGAVLVLDGLGRRQLGRGGLVEIIVVRPISAEGLLVSKHFSRKMRSGASPPVGGGLRLPFKGARKTTRT